jgi:hypothetical protein
LFRDEPRLVADLLNIPLREGAEVRAITGDLTVLPPLHE